MISHDITIHPLRGSDFQSLPELIHLLQGRHDGRLATGVCELENDLGIASDVDENTGAGR